MTEQSFGPEKHNDQINDWVNRSKKKENDWPAVVGVLGTLIIIATTIILLVKL